MKKLSVLCFLFCVWANAQNQSCLDLSGNYIFRSADIDCKINPSLIDFEVGDFRDELLSFPFFKNNIAFEKVERLKKFQFLLFNGTRIQIVQDPKNCEKLSVNLIFRDEVQKFLAEKKLADLYKTEATLDLSKLDKKGSFVESLVWDAKSLVFNVVGKKKLEPGRVGGSTKLALDYRVEFLLDSAKNLVIETYSKYKWDRGFWDVSREEEESRCVFERIERP